MIQQYLNRLSYTFKVMSRNKSKEEKKTIDATVIDEAILKKAVKDYLVENKIIPKEEVNFGKIKVLSLSFLNIWKIQYLQSLLRLEKLQIDNNIIQKIENLQKLKNLKWLDLSFNRIKVIQGLTELVNLTDLSLYNNQISQLDGLHNCTKLNIFSIGNNNIKSFEEVIAYFGRGSEKKTRFKYLQVLNVSGNPFTVKRQSGKDIKDPEYENNLIAFLPNLRYLDYIFIDEKRRKDIRQSDEKFKAEEEQSKFLIQLRVQEEKQRELEEEKKKKESAKMHLLDGYSEEIIRIQDLEKIQKMRGLEDEIQKFSSKVKELVEPTQKRVKEANQEKLRKIQQSEQKLYNKEKEAERKTAQLIDNFQFQKKNSVKIFDNRHLHKNWRDEGAILSTKIANLKDNLLNIEIQLMEDVNTLFSKQITLVIDDSNKALQSIINDEGKEIEEAGFFKKIEEQIKQFSVKLDKITKDEAERFKNVQSLGGQNQQEYDSQLYSILENSETIPAMVAGIKEMLNEKKSKKQSEIDNDLCIKFKESYTKQFIDRQYERNRKNVRNINQKIIALQQQLRTYMAYNDDEEDD